MGGTPDRYAASTGARSVREGCLGGGSSAGAKSGIPLLALRETPNASPNLHADSCAGAGARRPKRNSFDAMRESGGPVKSTPRGDKHLQLNANLLASGHPMSSARSHATILEHERYNSEPDDRGFDRDGGGANDVRQVRR